MSRRQVGAVAIAVVVGLTSAACDSPSGTTIDPPASDAEVSAEAVGVMFAVETASTISVSLAAEALARQDQSFGDEARALHRHVGEVLGSLHGGASAATLRATWTTAITSTGQDVTPAVDAFASAVSELTVGLDKEVVAGHLESIVGRLDAGDTVGLMQSTAVMGIVDAIVTASFDRFPALLGHHDPATAATEDRARRAVAAVVEVLTTPPPEPSDAPSALVALRDDADDPVGVALGRWIAELDAPTADAARQRAAEVVASAGDDQTARGALADAIETITAAVAVAESPRGRAIAALEGATAVLVALPPIPVV